MKDVASPIDDALLPRVSEFTQRHHTAMLVVLFTDVEGSTELAERLGEVPSQEVRRSLEKLLRGIVERNGAGECLKTIGDSLLCIFAEPSVAVQRALEIQARVRSWSEEAQEPDDATAKQPASRQLRVRVGMHLGQVLVEGGVHRDVFGRHVNRAARVQGLAHGGQILMTHAVYDSARGWLEGDPVQWHDHGEYLLKGIPEPTRILEVCDQHTAPRQPAGTPTSKAPRRRWAAWIAVAALAISATLFALSAAPLSCQLRVEVVRGGRPGYSWLETLPHRAADQFVFIGDMSRPAWSALVWIGSAGEVELKAESGAPVALLRFPSDSSQAVPLVGPPGAEVALLICSDRQLDAAAVVRELQALGPPPSFGAEPPYAVWISDSRVWRDPVYRNAGQPQPIPHADPLSFAERIRSVLRQNNAHVSGIILRHP